MLKRIARGKTYLVMGPTLKKTELRDWGKQNWVLWTLGDLETAVAYDLLHVFFLNTRDNTFHSSFIHSA